MEDLSGDIAAHTLLLRILVSKAQLQNQNFRNDAQKAFDEYLGKFALEPVNPIYVKARKKFAAILDTRTDLFTDQADTNKPTTWRRRLLFWLLHD
jgi:hypothetical protein